MSEIEFPNLRSLVGLDEIEPTDDSVEKDFDNRIHYEAGILVDSPEFFYKWPENPVFRNFSHVNNCRDTASRPLVFRHIPKTGGTSLNARLRQHFEVENSFVQREWDAFRTYPLARLMNLQFVSGHFGETAAVLLKHRDPFQIAVVRNPLDQVPSLYGQYLRAGLVAEQLTLEEWLYTEEGMAVVTNNQSRALTINLITRNQQGESRKVMSWEDTLDLLSLVKLAVSEIDLLGVTEKLDYVYEETARRFAWNNRTPSGKLNVSLAQNSVNSDMKTQIEKLTQIDRWLYEEASRVNRKI